MCDTCPKSFCVDCVTRNLGKKESNHVRDMKIWSCYCCFPTEKLKKISVNEETSLKNIDTAYQEIKPPKKSGKLSINNIFLHTTVPEKIKNDLKNGEKCFLQFFTDNIDDNNNPILKQVGIIDYLSTRDVRTLHQISKNVREVMKCIMFFPGLFKTPTGEENSSRLYGKKKEKLLLYLHANHHPTHTCTHSLSLSY